jgi:hypothetical protein
MDNMPIADPDHSIFEWIIESVFNTAQARDNSSALFS